MVERVDRLEAQDERGVTMLFEYHRCKQSCFETMRAAMPDNAAKAAERGAPPWFVVIGQTIEKALNREW